MTHHPSPKDRPADRPASRLRAKPHFRNPSALQSYHCRRCGKFHLGKDRRQGVKDLRKTADHEAGSYKARKARYAELTK